MKSYVTLLQTNDYLDGVLALNQSLKNVNSLYPLTVILSDQIEPKIREILHNYHISYMEIENYNYPDEYKSFFQRRAMPHWSNTSNKLKIFGLEQFEKIVFLDCDMIVVKNIDHLFKKENFTAAEDSPILYDSYERDSHYQLNSGLIVIEPNKEVERDLIELSLKHCLPDQDIIRLYLKDWVKQPQLHLPAYYNYFAPEEEKYINEGYLPQNAYVFHFIGRYKIFFNNSFLTSQKASYYSEKIFSIIVSQLKRN